MNELRRFLRQVLDTYAELIKKPMIWVITAGLAALAGVFDIMALFTEVSSLGRVAIWMALFAGGIALGFGIRAVLHYFQPDRAVYREDVLVSLGLCFVYAPILSLVPAPTDSRPGLPTIVALIFGTALVVSSIRRAVEEPLSEVAVRDRLFERLDGTTGASIVRLSSSDHHVVVYFSDRSMKNLRLRLRDAVKEMDVTPGVCVHRSHWVALEDIQGVITRGAKEMVQLKSSPEVPVGPKYRGNLVDLDLIECREPERTAPQRRGRLSEQPKRRASSN